MTPRSPRRLALVASLAGLVMATTAACSANPAPEGTTPGAEISPTTPAVEPSNTPAPEETGGVPAADVTCETLIAPDLVTELTDMGWTARKDPFIIGDLELSGGLACTWGDFTSETSSLLLFGWSPISDGEAEASQALLLSEGWLSEEGPDGVYITEDPAQAITLDDEGYGVTYLFGDGWVTVSDVKQGLVLIERPVQ